MTGNEWSVFYLKTIRVHQLYSGEWVICCGDDERWPVGSSVEDHKGFCFSTEQEALNVIEIVKYFGPHFVKAYQAIKDKSPYPEVGGYEVSHENEIKVSRSKYSWEDLQGGLK